ncbi:MAG TPA: hypothetical protein VHD31_03080 [Candidatus Paceibacterota bacterium]|nr:hypothetical protein [Candidatus Paceibacterota bacterium]
MKDRQILYFVSALLVVSFLANIYLWKKPESRQVPILNTSQATSSEASLAIESPYGFRSEVVTVYENGKAKTYSTTTPITEKDLEQMRKQTEARMKAMDEYFEEQEKFFRDFWRNF